SELGPVPASLAPPRRSASLGRLLPDGVPLEGLLGALSSLVGSASPWWTPSGTGHLPLPASIHIDVQVTVPLTSLAGLALLGDPTGRGNPGGGECSEGPRHPKSGRASPDQNPTITTDLNGAAPWDGRRSLPTADGRSLPGSSGWSLPEPTPAAPTASLSAAPVSQPAASLPAAATGVAEVRIGARSAAVPALTAWALAAGGTWRRLITDPASGTVVDVGRSRYRPPAGLADLVRARDRACVFPTCQTPAERCDIDHLTAWSQGGTTSLDNLATLCEAHHRLKHTPGWALTRDQAGGILSWHTPDKTVYQRHPNGTITRLPRKTGPHQHHVPGAVVPTDLSKQINPDILNRLNRALDTALDNQAHNHTGPGTNTNGSTSPRLETRGPQPGQRAGAYETTPYPKAAHTLQLAPLIDQAPPF
ncbi:HNH endonuclease signature motif containing protein, partial [Actinomyces oris]|uniref:HNH endonuclease signature motif containing protein n=1 Tax=Actinomyces oris TaxID=544580 RepID=UPI0028EFD391